MVWGEIRDVEIPGKLDLELSEGMKYRFAIYTDFEEVLWGNTQFKKFDNGVLGSIEGFFAHADTWSTR